jgi:anti-sigma factor RsiW
MEVTRDLIVDLLPAYVCGDASPGTRLIVEAFLERDPELARIVKNASVTALQQPLGSPPDRQKEALDQTKRLIRRAAWLQTVAIFLTLFMFFLEWSSSGIRFLLMRYRPLAVVSIVIVLGCWIAYFRVRARLRVAGY